MTFLQKLPALGEAALCWEHGEGISSFHQLEQVDPYCRHDSYLHSSSVEGTWDIVTKE